MKASFSGYKYLDEDGNGQRASTLLQGSPPKVVLVLDRSGSTTAPFLGKQTVPDLNGDFIDNTILDSEIAATGELLSFLIKGGNSDSRLALISFRDSADVEFEGKPTDITNGEYDFYTSASALKAGGGTSYTAALEKAEELVGQWNAGPTNIIFLSDGRPNGSSDGIAAAGRLQQAGHNIQAFGVGKNTPVGPLNAIDSDGTAFIFSDSDSLFNTLNGNLVGDVLSSLSFTENGLEDVEIYVDINGNGALDQGEPVTTTDSDGNYKLDADIPAFGTYELREVEPTGYTQTEGNHFITFDQDGQEFKSLNFGNTKSAVKPIDPPPAQLPTADFTAPYITEATADGKVVTITFNEEIQQDSGLVINDRFKINAGKKTFDISDYTISTEKRFLTLNLEEEVTFRDNLKLSYVDSTNDQTEGVIQDIAGNDMVSFAKKEIDNYTGSTTVLEVQEASANDREIELTFNDSLIRSTPKKSSLKVTVNGLSNKVKDIIIGEDEMTATLVMKTSIYPGEEVLISYRDKNGDQKRNVFQNEVGDDLASFKNLVVTNGDPADSAAPTLVMAYGRFDELTLEFDEVLQAGRISPGFFKVKDELSNYRVRNAMIGKNSNKVILDMKSDLPAFTTNLTLDYIDMSGNQSKGVIQSAGGTDVASILGKEIFIL